MRKIFLGDKGCAEDVQAVSLDLSQAPVAVPQHHPSGNVGSRHAIDRRYA
jgi:hypothetical protein